MKGRQKIWGKHEFQGVVGSFQLYVAAPQTILGIEYDTHSFWYMNISKNSTSKKLCLKMQSSDEISFLGIFD
jgi:hypothetical protein